MEVRQALDRLQRARAGVGKKVSLYPYASFVNASYLDKLLSVEGTDFKTFVTNKRILDIGCGDGDMAFLCEMIGARDVAALDHADTNYNYMQGVRSLREELQSKIHVISGNIEDMDMSFLGVWDAILFLGILYHLPNPIRVLRKLSVVAPRIFASTRVFDVLPGENRVNFSKVQVGYMLTPLESNNDNTNWWVLSEAAVKTVLERSGWRILTAQRMDQVVGAAEPADPKKDGRLFLSAHSMYL
jgi:tRNA (mo5U34)-methyltransferase